MEKKILFTFQSNLNINYICNLQFTDKTILSIMKFYKYIYCLKSLNANSFFACFFGHLYSAK